MIAQERHKGYRLWALSLAHTLRGERDAADAALAELKAAPDANAYWIARLYAARGNKAAAFEWLNKACSERQHGCDLLKSDRFLRGLRDDARYAALLTKLAGAAVSQRRRIAACHGVRLTSSAVRGRWHGRTPCPVQSSRQQGPSSVVDLALDFAAAARSSTARRRRCATAACRERSLVDRVPIAQGRADRLPAVAHERGESQR